MYRSSTCEDSCFRISHQQIMENFVSLFVSDEAAVERVVVVGAVRPLIDRCLEADPDLFRLVEEDLDLDQDRIESIESG